MINSIAFLALYIIYVLVVVFQSRYDSQANSELREKANNYLIEMKEGINLDQYMQVIDMLPPSFEDQQIGLIDE